MIKVFSLLATILFFILLPPAILAFASQDALPGDRLYPFKRGLENGILTIASLYPTSKAWFSLDYTNRRFTEATTLINKGEVAEAKSSLNELVEQTSKVALEIKTVQNQEQKEKLLVELNKSINDYKQGLTQVKQGVQTTNVNPANSTQSAPPQPQPSLTTFSPTPSATPLAYNSQPQESFLNSIDQDIEETIDELDEISEDLEDEKDKLHEGLRGRSEGRSKNNERDFRINRGKSENEDRREIERQSNGGD